METNKMLKSSMTYGLVTGLVLIGFSLLLYVTNLYLNQAFGYFTYLILAMCIFYTGRHYRDTYQKGTIAYGQALGLGVLVGVFAAILLAFFTFLEIKFIDPSIVDKQLDIMQQKMLEKGLSEDQITQAIAMTKKFMTPGLLFITTILSVGFISLIISLVTSIFVKKDPNPFDAAMQKNA